MAVHGPLRYSSVDIVDLGGWPKEFIVKEPKLLATSCWETRTTSGFEVVVNVDTRAVPEHTLHYSSCMQTPPGQRLTVMVTWEYWDSVGDLRKGNKWHPYEPLDSLLQRRTSLLDSRCERWYWPEGASPISPWVRLLLKVPRLQGLELPASPAPGQCCRGSPAEKRPHKVLIAYR